MAKRVALEFLKNPALVDNCDPLCWQISEETKDELTETHKVVEKPKMMIVDSHRQLEYLYSPAPWKGGHLISVRTVYHVRFEFDLVADGSRARRAI